MFSSNPEAINSPLYNGLGIFREYMVDETAYADTQVTLSIIVLVIVFIISPIIIFLVRHATYTIQVSTPRRRVSRVFFNIVYVCTCMHE